MPFILHNMEQLDVTEEQADALEALALIYQPEPEVNPHYYTTCWNVSLDDVEAAIETP